MAGLFTTTEDLLRGRIALLEAELAELKRLASAVVGRWDTPLWKDVPATANYINALRTWLEANK